MDYIKAFKKYLQEDLDRISDKDAKLDFDDLDDKDIDNDGDVDDTDSYLHNKLGNVALRTEEEGELDEFVQIDQALKQFRKELEKHKRTAKKPDDLPANYNIYTGKFEEANATGNLDGGLGPPKTPYAFGNEEDENDNAEQFGYKKVKESTFMKMSKQLHEISYREFKKDPTSTPQQKVNRGIMEVNKMLGEMEKIVQNNLRLKTEMGVQSNHFWKATGKRFAKINERMTRISNRLKELSQ